MCLALCSHCSHRARLEVILTEKASFILLLMSLRRSDISRNISWDSEMGWDRAAVSGGDTKHGVTPGTATQPRPGSKCEKMKIKRRGLRTQRQSCPMNKAQLTIRSAWTWVRMGCAAGQGLVRALQAAAKLC